MVFKVNKEDLKHKGIHCWPSEYLLENVNKAARPADLYGYLINE